MELRQPLFIRIFHWSFAVVSFMLITLGFYIHQPSYIYPLRDPRQVIFWLDIFAYVITFLFLARILYGLYQKEYRHILFNRYDAENLLEFLRYLFFFQAEYQQDQVKYNPLQKLLFSSWLLVMCLMLLTGVILYAPESFIAWQLIFGNLQHVRTLHYLLTVWFALTIPGHIYFALTSDPAKLQAMFTGYVQKNSQ